LIHKNGTLIDVEIKANWLKLGGRELMQGFFYDITDRKRLMDEYRRSAQLAALAGC